MKVPDVPIVTQILADRKAMQEHMASPNGGLIAFGRYFDEAMVTALAPAYAAEMAARLAAFETQLTDMGVDLSEPEEEPAEAA